MNHESRPLWDPDGRWVSDELVKTLRRMGNTRLNLQVLTTANLERTVFYGAFAFRFSNQAGTAPAPGDALFVDVTQEGVWWAHCAWPQLLDALEDVERHGEPPEPERHDKPELETRVKALEETICKVLQRIARIDGMPQ